nr:glycerol-3-phosphate 1-O-acyltransferase PlsY [Maliibacterium massiliense]
MTTREILMIALASVLAYLIGCISTAILLSKGVVKKDVRSMGSGNAGSTNMLRSFGWMYGLLTFAGDCLKGVLAVLLGQWLAGNMGGAFAGVFVVLGHCFPVFFKFKGGKGIATTIGVMLVVKAVVIIPIVAAGVLIIAITRYVSLGAIAGCLMAVAATWLAMPENLPMCIMISVAVVIDIFSHRANILRLIRGQERKLHAGKNPKKQDSAPPRDKEA